MSDAPEPNPDASLDAILATLWSGLAAAVRDRDHPWHLPTVATIGLDGSPQVRTVVLRAVDPVTHAIACHTDVRSPKVAEIAANSCVAWHLYDPRERVQLRISAVATIHRAADNDPLALERWSASTLSARRCYLAPRAPGDPCDGPSANLPEHLLDRSPVAGEDAPGRDHFAVVLTKAVEIDWLWLRAAGHRRARFAIGEGGSWIEP